MLQEKKQPPVTNVVQANNISVLMLWALKLLRVHSACRKIGRNRCEFVPFGPDMPHAMTASRHNRQRTPDEDETCETPVSDASDIHRGPFYGLSNHGVSSQSCVVNAFTQTK